MFRNSPEVNYRAIRDMGLGAWWGASLMGLASLTKAADTQPLPAERHRVEDAGWKASRGLTFGAVTAYLLGLQLVRFDGDIVKDGKPRWISEGLDNPRRTVATVVALVSAIAAKTLREKEGELLARGDKNAVDEAEQLRTKAHALHVLTPASVGWLLYSHTKEDAEK